jgi:outer membrane receptor protein involved in Fe transport
MKMDWQFNPHAMVRARVKNLTDEVYAEWGRGGTTPMLLIREPRTFQMELKLDF